jgi:DoxX-like family
MTSLLTITNLGWLLSIIVSLMLGKGAIEKIIGTQEMVGNFEYMKLSKYRTLVGVGELLSIALFLIPITSLYGAILIGSFMSAAVALHLSLMGGNKVSFPFMIGVVVFIGYFLR